MTDHESIMFNSNGPDMTYALGQRLSELLTGGDVVGLYGDLGSGKTLMAQGICLGLDVKDYVTSPSFTIMQMYEGRLPVYHFDFYRLNSPKDVENLDVDSYLESNGITLVEWPEMGETFFPKDKFSVTISRILKNNKIVEKKRTIRIEGPKNRGLDGLDK